MEPEDRKHQSPDGDPEKGNDAPAGSVWPILRGYLGGRPFRWLGDEDKEGDKDRSGTFSVELDGSRGPSPPLEIRVVPKQETGWSVPDGESDSGPEEEAAT